MLTMDPVSITLLLLQRCHTRWVFNVPGAAGWVSAVGSKHMPRPGQEVPDGLQTGTW